MMSYKMFQHLTHVPESLQMDLIGIIQDDNLEEKRYVCVYYDDYSKIEFIREKPHNSFAFKVLCHHLQCDKG